MTDLTELSLFEVLINDNYKDSLLNYLATLKNVQIRELGIKEEKKEKELGITEKLKKLRSNLISLFNKLEIEEINLLQEDKVEFKVTSLYNLIGYLSDETEYYNNRLAELNEYQIKAQFELENLVILKNSYKFLQEFGINRENLQIFNFFNFKVFTTFSKNIPNLKLVLDTFSFPVISQIQDLGTDRSVFFIIYPKSEESSLIKEFKLLHTSEIPLLKKYITAQGINLDRLEKEIDLVARNLSRLQKEKDTIKENNLHKFFAFKETLENIEIYNWCEKQFLKTSSNNSVITFYIPSTATKQAKEELLRLFENNIKISIIEITKKVLRVEDEKKKQIKADKTSPEEQNIVERYIDKTNLRDEAPTIMKHKSFVRHFEILTKMYGVPAYTEVDPTWFVALSFPFLFGLMFGDIGHGLVLVIVGLIGARVYKDKKINRYHFSYIIVYCGIGAILAGFLYGEWFGGHEIFGLQLTALWVNPLDDIFLVFLFSLYVGIAQICLGWFIQLLNYWKLNKKYLAITDSLFKILMLVGGAILIFSVGFNFNDWFPIPILLPGIPGFLLLVSKPMGRRLGISYLQHDTYGQLISEGTMEAFELVLSTLSNVASYARLLALEMAHIGLLLSFEAMIGLIQEPGLMVNTILGIIMGGILFGILGFLLGGRYKILGLILGAILGSLLGFLVGYYEILTTIGLIFGNTFVIILEGLLVFIHDLRLHFYEFFSKFYQGSGIEFKSFQLNEEYSKIIFEVKEKEDIIFAELEKLINPQDKIDLDTARTKVISKFIKE